MGINTLSHTAPRPTEQLHTVEQKSTGLLSRLKEKFDTTRATVNAQIQSVLDNATDFVTRDRFLPGQQEFEASVQATYENTRDAIAHTLGNAYDSISDVARRSQRAAKGAVLAGTTLASLTACGVPSAPTGISIPQPAVSTAPSAAPSAVASVAPETEKPKLQITQTEEFGAVAPGEVFLQEDGSRTTIDLSKNTIGLDNPDGTVAGFVMPDSFQAMKDLAGNSVMLTNTRKVGDTLYSTTADSGISFSTSILDSKWNLLTQEGWFSEPENIKIGQKSEVAVVDKLSGNLVILSDPNKRQIDVAEYPLEIKQMENGKEDGLVAISHGNDTDPTTTFIGIYDPASLNQATSAPILRIPVADSIKPRFLSTVQTSTGEDLVAVGTHGNKEFPQKIKVWRINKSEAAQNGVSYTPVLEQDEITGTLSSVNMFDAALQFDVVVRENNQVFQRVYMVNYPANLQLGLQNQTTPKGKPELFLEKNITQTEKATPDPVQITRLDEHRFAVAENGKVIIYKVEKGTAPTAQE